MRITRTNPFNLKQYTLEIPVTKEQLDNWNNGMDIKQAMPNVKEEMIDYILYGIMADGWEDVFNPD